MKIVYTVLLCFSMQQLSASLSESGKLVSAIAILNFFPFDLVKKIAGYAESHEKWVIPGEAQIEEEEIITMRPKCICDFFKLDKVYCNGKYIVVAVNEWSWRRNPEENFRSQLFEYADGIAFVEEFNSSAVHASFSRDNNFLVTRSGFKHVLWHIASKKCSRKSTMSPIAFSPDSDVMFSALGNSLYAEDITLNYEKRWEFESKEYDSHLLNKEIIFGLNDSDKKIEGTYQLQARAIELAIAAKKKLVAVLDMEHITFFDRDFLTPRNTITHNIPKLNCGVLNFAFSPLENHVIVINTTDGFVDGAYIFDINTGEHFILAGARRVCFMSPFSVVYNTRKKSKNPKALYVLDVFDQESHTYKYCEPKPLLFNSEKITDFAITPDYKKLIVLGKETMSSWRFK